MKRKKINVDRSFVCMRKWVRLLSGIVNGGTNGSKVMALYKTSVAQKNLRLPNP